ncbi:MAG: methylated-DNA--[protein]-cysteine S-methyltransferase [Anaerolineae bacterium]
MVEDAGRTRPFIGQIFTQPTATTERPSLKLFLKGSSFQIKVWQALLQIPPGMVVSYGSVGHLIGQPKAVRAIGTATGHNPIAYLIPCHRVIRQTGGFGNYRWGAARKKAMLG